MAKRSSAKAATSTSGAGPFPNRHDKGYGHDPTLSYNEQFRPTAGRRANQPGPASEAARKLADELRVDQQEPYRVAQARRALQATTGETRDAVLAQLYTMAADEYELDAFRAMKAEVDLAHPAEVVDDPVARQVAEALAPKETEPPAPPAGPAGGPYIDDSGAVRDPAGNLIDPTSESWWDAGWAPEAARLLGPEWMAGHNPGEDSDELPA